MVLGALWSRVCILGNLIIELLKPCNLIICVFSDQVAEHSHAVSMWCKELCALDCVYREVLPHLWFNANTKTVHTTKCKPPKVGRQQPECSGEASIVLEVSRCTLLRPGSNDLPLQKQNWAGGSTQKGRLVKGSRQGVGENIYMCIC